MKEMTRSDRIDSILDAAMEIVFANGLASLTLQQIADRSGISRQSLFGYFRSTGDVLNALFERTYRQIVIDPYPDELDYLGILDGLRKRVSVLFTAPAPIVAVVAAAFHGGQFTEQGSIRNKLLERLELNWIQPIVRSGLPSDIATSGVYAVVGAAMLFRDLIDRGIIDVELADVQIRRIAEELLGRIDVESLLPPQFAVRD